MLSQMIHVLQAGFFRYPLGSFVILHGLGGRTASIIAARLAGFDMALYLPLAIFLDMIQVPLLFFLYEETGERISFLRRLKDRAERQKERLANSRVYKKLVLLGQLGVVLMTLLPIKGGGMWSGAFLAHLIQMQRSRSYLLLFAGSLLGGLLLVGLSDLIREAWVWLRQS